MNTAMRVWRQDVATAYYVRLIYIYIYINGPSWRYWKVQRQFWPALRIQVKVWSWSSILCLLLTGIFKSSVLHEDHPSKCHQKFLLVQWWERVRQSHRNVRKHARLPKLIHTPSLSAFFNNQWLFQICQDLFAQSCHSKTSTLHFLQHRTALLLAKTVRFGLVLFKVDATGLAQAQYSWIISEWVRFRGRRSHVTASTDVHCGPSSRHRIDSFFVSPSMFSRHGLAQYLLLSLVWQMFREWFHGQFWWRHRSWHRRRLQHTDCNLNRSMKCILRMLKQRPRLRDHHLMHGPSKVAQHMGWSWGCPGIGHVFWKDQEGWEGSEGSKLRSTSKVQLVRFVFRVIQTSRFALVKVLCLSPLLFVQNNTWNRFTYSLRSRFRWRSWSWWRGWRWRWWIVMITICWNVPFSYFRWRRQASTACIWLDVPEANSSGSVSFSSFQQCITHCVAGKFRHETQWASDMKTV